MGSQTSAPCSEDLHGSSAEGGPTCPFLPQGSEWLCWVSNGFSSSSQVRAIKCIQSLVHFIMKIQPCRFQCPSHSWWAISLCWVTFSCWISWHFENNPGLPGEQLSTTPGRRMKLLNVASECGLFRVSLTSHTFPAPLSTDRAFCTCRSFHHSRCSNSSFPHPGNSSSFFRLQLRHRSCWRASPPFPVTSTHCALRPSRVSPF